MKPQRNEVEAYLKNRFGNKLEPIRDSLENRHTCAQMARQGDRDFRIKGGYHNADRVMREKLCQK